LQLYIGCSGWSYRAWSGHFYPAKLESKNYLEYYSKVFDYVEIDSSFYRTPSTLMTSRWAKVTSDNFKFTAKIPQEVTHKKRLGQSIDNDMHCFTRILSLSAYDELRSTLTERLSLVMSPSLSTAATIAPQKLLTSLL
jgi:uncharacterized protein YecE (DUF72 family)